MKTTQIGIDLAKSVFEVAVSHAPGRVDEGHRLSRARLERFLAQGEPAEVLLEACSSAHHWGRVFEGFGHQVSLLHPGDVARYPYLGLTPREHSTGHRRRLGRITKRGNSYLRMLLVHGARAALRACTFNDEPDDLRAWALRIQRRSGHNVAAVALANKLARVSWRVWRDQRPFELRPAAQDAWRSAPSSQLLERSDDGIPV